MITDTRRSPHARLGPVPIGDFRINGGFWGPRLERLRTVSLPAQLDQCEATGRLDNFRRASGRIRDRSFAGRYYNDSDVHKWLEAASHMLAGADDAALEARLDAVIDEVVAAQRPDGYLSSYFSLERASERYSDLTNKHELYCAGHLIQAGLAHVRATGKRALFDAAVRLADHICETFGADRLRGADGHEEIELALVELYRETGDRRYLDRAVFFLGERGLRPPRISGDAYHQDHAPVRAQSEAVGHAVRATYLACGMQDVSIETGDRELARAVRRMWTSAFERKAYVTGALGSRADGEALGADYELPNEAAYAETCAAVGAFMWNWRLLVASGDAAYADRMETALYNAVLAGISLDGRAYFYANPLAQPSAGPGRIAVGDAEAASSADPQVVGGYHRRQPWFECACCPPNIARLLASLSGYMWSIGDDELWLHIFANGALGTSLPGGERVVLRVETDYPWDGVARIRVEEAPGTPWALRVRIPGWCEGGKVRVNGSAAAEPVAGSYHETRRRWQAGDTVELALPLDVWRVTSDPRVAANRGRVAFARGPVVYCFEGCDHDVPDVDDLVFAGSDLPTATYRPDVFDGVTVLEGTTGTARGAGSSTRVRAVPYHAWANRAPGSMRVWVRSG